MSTTRKKRRANRALPQDISEKLMRTISEEQANVLLGNRRLRAYVERKGFDFDGMVARMRMTVTERFELLRQRIQALYEREEAEEEYRIHARI